MRSTELTTSSSTGTLAASSMTIRGLKTGAQHAAGGVSPSRPDRPNRDQGGRADSKAEASRQGNSAGTARDARRRTGGGSIDKCPRCNGCDQKLELSSISWTEIHIVRYP